MSAIVVSTAAAGLARVFLISIHIIYESCHASVQNLAAALVKTGYVSEIPARQHLAHLSITEARRLPVPSAPDGQPLLSSRLRLARCSRVSTSLRGLPEYVPVTISSPA